MEARPHLSAISGGGGNSHHLQHLWCGDIVILSWDLLFLIFPSLIFAGPFYSPSGNYTWRKSKLYYIYWDIVGILGYYYFYFYFLMGIDKFKQGWCLKQDFLKAQLCVTWNPLATELLRGSVKHGYEIWMTQVIRLDIKLQLQAGAGSTVPPAIPSKTSWSSCPQALEGGAPF